MDGVRYGPRVGKVRRTQRLKNALFNGCSESSDGSFFLSESRHPGNTKITLEWSLLNDKRIKRICPLIYTLHMIVAVCCVYFL